MAEDGGIADGLNGDEGFRPPADEDSVVPALLPFRIWPRSIRRKDRLSTHI